MAAHWEAVKRAARGMYNRRAEDRPASVEEDRRLIVHAFIPESDTPLMLRVRPIRVVAKINGFSSTLDISREDARRLGEHLLRLYREIGEPSPPIEKPASDD